MHIDAKESIAEISMLSVRKLLKRSSGFQWGTHSVCEALRVGKEKAEHLIHELQARGYIELSYVRDGEQFWQNTIAGNAIANASAAKPIGRKTAEKALAEFMNRVSRVNRDQYFLYKVVRVVLFGSYLTNAQKVNDIDIALELAPKEDNQEHRRLLFDQRRTEAQEKGIRFRSIVDYAGLPQLEVLKFLKAHSRVISIHPLEDGLADGINHQVIYTEEQSG